MGVFWLFLLATCLGSLSTLYWIRETEMGRGYFQMNALVILGLLALASAVYVLHPLAPFGATSSAAGAAALAAAVVGACLYYGAVWQERWALGRWPLSLALAGCLVALLASGPSLVSEPTPLPYRQLLLATALVTSALLLGWSLITMLLGHWYLVSPRLAFRHLVIFCRVLLILVVVRMVAVGATLWTAGSIDPTVEPHPLRLVAGFQGQGMFFWFRLLWGLAVPLLLAMMALHCARHRSNQSATGILYVLLVGTFIGEVTAYYLIVTTGVPV